MLLSRLRAIQQRDHLTDGEMAARLGIARTTWTDTKNGRLPISAKTQLAAAGAFPELLGDLLRQVSSQGAA